LLNGTDVFNAGAGDDTIIINDDNLAKLYSNTLASHLLSRVDGGGNTDTLKLAGSNLNFSKYHMRFTYIGVCRMSTNNQIIQAIAIDIAC
jgi:hypothetical protein